MAPYFHLLTQLFIQKHKIMKKINAILSIALMAGMFFAVTPAYSQVTKEEKAEAKAQAKTQKTTEKNLFSKSPKEVQKEAKKLEKAGWKSMNLPIAKQLETTWMKMYEMDVVSGYTRYITATEEAIGNSFAAAQMQTDNLCKVRIAGQIQTYVMSEAKAEIANQSLSATEAASITKVLEKSTNMVSQKLGRLTKTMEIYRIVNGNYVVRVTMIYDMNKIMDMVKAEAVQELQKDLDNWTPTYEKVIDAAIEGAKSKYQPE